MKFFFQFIVFYLVVNNIQSQDSGAVPRSLKLVKTFIGKDLNNEVAAFLQTQVSNLKENKSTLTIAHNKRSHLGTHLTYNQLVNNYPVFGGGVKVNLNKKLQIVSGYDYSVSFHKTSGNELVNKTTLETKVLQLSKGKITNSELCWYLIDSTLRFSRRIITTRDKLGGTTEWIFDVETGLELVRNRLERHFCTPPPKDTTVMGNIFNPDPLTSARVNYGVPYIDNNDNDNPVLTSQLQLVALRNITYDENLQTFNLVGPYVKILDLEAPTIVTHISPIDSFLYSRSQPQFEGVMCYYHIDNFQRYVQSLGFIDLWNKQIQIDPHGENADNSTFNPAGNNSYILFGVGGIDDAEDADVIIHEYIHALSDDASPGANAGNVERTGLDEGLGDYFAASYSRRISDYNWGRIFNWDGNAAGFSGRSVVSNSRYSPSLGNLYVYGEIWSLHL